MEEKRIWEHGELVRKRERSILRERERKQDKNQKNKKDINKNEREVEMRKGRR